MELHNLYSIDIFLQGFFLFACGSLGSYILFGDNLENINDAINVKRFSQQLSDILKQFLNIFSFNSAEKEPNFNSRINYLGLVPILIGFIFLTGIMGFGFADNWIDSSPINHLGLKSLWGSKSSIDSNYSKRLEITDFNPEKYKSYIRYKAFNAVFAPPLQDIDASRKRDIKQLYYHAKHEIMRDTDSFNFIRKSQSFAEYNRVFALGFYILLICSFLNLVVMIFRVLWKKEENENTNPHPLITVPNLILLLFATVSTLAVFFFAYPQFYSHEFGVLTIIQLIIVFFGNLTFLVFFVVKFRPLKFSFFAYSLLYVISISGYLVSCKMWLQAENEVALKTFGIYKANHLSNQVKEIEFANQVLKLNIIDSERKIDTLKVDK